MMIVSRIFVAVKILKYLAVHNTGRVTTNAMSKGIGVPRPYLMRVANQLIHAGFIRAARGRNGGLTLSRPPSAIRLGEVWTVIDETRQSSGLGEAVANEGVPAFILEDAIGKFVQVLDEHTLADLPQSDPKPLRKNQKRRPARFPNPRTRSCSVTTRMPTRL